MGSSIDMKTGQPRLTAVAASRALAHSHPAAVTWSGGPQTLADEFDDDAMPVAPVPIAARPVSLSSARADPSATEAVKTIELGALSIVPGARTVLVNGTSVDIGSRAFDVLMVLVNARGEIVSKETIMASVWPTTTVVESNLKVQLSILRRALGAERARIKTVSGRGYLLVLHDRPVETEEPDIALLPVAGKPLVIVVDGDPGTQALLMRAVADFAKTCSGITRLSIVPGGSGEHTLRN